MYKKNTIGYKIKLICYINFKVINAYGEVAQLVRAQDS